MPEITRERVVRSYGGKDRDDYSSDDDRSSYGRSRVDGSSYRTVQRYRVAPGRDRDRVEEIEDDRRSSRLEIVPRAGERIEIDRRSERFVDRPDRPRSAIDIRPQSTFIERDRVIEREREPFREPERERERTRTVVVERESPREPDFRRPWERAPNRPWESERDVRETDVRIEKRTTERREEPYELERVQREIEYFDRPDPPPQPIIIRQRAPEPQQIIVQEAPPPAPIVLPPREEQGFEVVRREEIRQEVARPEPRREEEDYYYRRDVREVGPGRRDEEFAMTKYDRRDLRPRDSISDGEYSDSSDYIVRRRIVRRRSRSGSPHHKRHLAEGALAGAGVAALVGNHREKTGNGPEHRGRNVVGGAALGALGAEVITRARSRYREHREDRSRSRSSSRHSHTKLKTAIGLAAAGLAAAAAAKYVSNRNANKEETYRGRSRTRSVSRRRGSSYDSDYESRTRTTSKHRDPKHRSASIAKAAAGTAAVAGVIEHIRNKSRERSGKRSKSRIRTGAEIAGAGLAGAAVAGLYENRKAKEEERDDEVRRERRRSRSRARSVGAYSDPGVDPELGMVQYGTEPVYTERTTTYREYDRGSRSRSRSRHRRHSSSSDDRRHKSRSRSRVRDIAGAAAGTAAAAIGIKQYQKRKEKKEAERERERRHYEEEPSSNNYYARDYPDDGYSPSPPHASGGSYYPQNNQFPPPPAPGFAQHPNISTPNVAQPPIPPYNPADYAGQAPPAVPHDNYGYPPAAPRAGDNVSSSNNLPHQSPAVNAPYVPPSAGATNIPYFPPPPTVPFADEPRNEEARVIYTPPSSPELGSERPHNKSVTFAPLSPTSSRRLDKARKAQSGNQDESTPLSNDRSSPTSSQDDLVRNNDPPTDHVYDAPQSSLYESGSRRRRRHRRRNSDPSSDRPNQSTRHRRRRRHSSRSPSPTSDSDETVVLPDRFDRDGRLIERGHSSRKPPESEMVERVVHSFGDVVEGRKTWKDMLKELVESSRDMGSGSDRGGSDRRLR